MALPTRPLGRTGVSVTTLGFGAMEIRGPRIWQGRPVEDAEAERMLHAVLDAGINLIDTAPDYGRSEEFIGRFLAGRRAEYFLATKCGCHVVPAGDHDETPHLWTRDNLMENIETSLRRMRTDHVDLLQLHNPAVADVDSGALVETLLEIRSSGKARFLGCSSTLPHLATYLTWDVFDVFQIPYSGLEREHEDCIHTAARAGAGVIVRGGVARGEPLVGLGGQQRWAAWNAAGLDELRQDGESPTQFLLRFTLTHPGLSTTIVGTKNPNHLAQNVAAALRGPLPPAVYAEATRRLGDAGQRPSA